MSYTLLRVVEAGVVLREGHRARFASCEASVLEAFDAFCIEAPPSIYALRAEGGDLRVTKRERSAVSEGMPIGFAPSPYFGVGDFPKPAPPCPYDEVRIEGVCTFLTDPHGAEVIEACRGVALAFVEGTFVRAGSRFSRVTSVVEEFLVRERMPARRLEPGAEVVWAVANAVAGVVCLGEGSRGANDNARAASTAARAWTEAIVATASRRDAPNLTG